MLNKTDILIITKKKTLHNIKQKKKKSPQIKSSVSLFKKLLRALKLRIHLHKFIQTYMNVL